MAETALWASVLGGGRGVEACCGDAGGEQERGVGGEEEEEAEEEKVADVLIFTRGTPLIVT